MDTHTQGKSLRVTAKVYRHIAERSGTGWYGRDKRGRCRKMGTGHGVSMFHEQRQIHSRVKCAGHQTSFTEHVPPKCWHVRGEASHDCGKHIVMIKSQHTEVVSS